MKRFQKLLFPALTLCFLLLLIGYFLGRRSVEGVVLATQRPVPVETGAAPSEPVSRVLPEAATSPAGEDARRVELNSATLEELMTLPGIGEVRAKQILDYREENGPFRQATDLMNVKGIGEGIFSGLRELIYVEESNEDPDH